MLVAMPGFVVGAQLDVDGEWWLYVETTADFVGCANCGTRAVGHGRRRVKVRDLPIAGRPVVMVWAKWIWGCPEPECEVRTWSERHEAIAPRAALSERARAEICSVWRTPMLNDAERSPPPERQIPVPAGSASGADYQGIPQLAAGRDVIATARTPVQRPPAHRRLRSFRHSDPWWCNPCRRRLRP